MYNLTHNEDSSLDITHKWYGGLCFIKFRKGHDELGVSTFEFALDADEIDVFANYLQYTLKDQ